LKMFLQNVSIVEMDWDKWIGVKGRNGLGSNL
jgi:hypothetical protein